MGGHAYFMTNDKNLIEYLNTIQQSGFHFIKDIICDLYNDGWDFTKDIDFLEIVGE